MKKIVVVLGIIAVVVVVSAGGMELLARCYSCLKPGGSWKEFFSTNGGTYTFLPFTAYDPELGWKTIPDYGTYFFYTDENGKYVTSHYTTKKYGFRKFGDTASNRKKVLIVGDSFTNAINIDDSKTYYAQLGDAYEVFVYGVSGYGTYQEYLILKKYMETIQPDVVVVQFCGNDVSDDHLPLEKLSLYNNQLQIRPYVSPAGKAYMAIPARNYFEGKLLFGNTVLRYSRSAFLLATALKELSLRAMKSSGKYFEAPRTDPSLLPVIDDAYQALFQGYGLIRALVPGKLVVLPTDENPRLEHYCADHGIDFLKTHFAAFASPRYKDQRIVGPDGHHWNNLGHAVVGTALKGYLDGLFPPSKAPKGAGSGEG